MKRRWTPWGTQRTRGCGSRRWPNLANSTSTGCDLVVSTYLSQSTWLSSQGGVQQAGQDSEAAEAELPNWGGWGWSQEGNSVAWGHFTIFIWWDLIRWNRCMPLRSRCTQLRRTTRNWKPCTIKASTSNQQFPILLSLESSGLCQTFMHTLESTTYLGNVEERCTCERASSRKPTQTSLRFVALF